MRAVRTGNRERITECALLTLLLLIPSLFFVTGQSLWVDEIYSVWFADHTRNLNTNQWHFLLAVPEMPGFHVLLTVWVHLFGDSERAVRSLNLPFAALFLGSIVFICRWANERRYWLYALPFAFFPMLTYYVNECRPYTALLGLSAVSAAAFWYASSDEAQPCSRAPAWWCSLAALLAFSMHLLGILVPGTLLLIVAVSSKQRRVFLSKRKQWFLPLATTVPGYILLLLYYVRVHGQGGPAERVKAYPDTPGNVASGWKNLTFFFYEMLGFDGLGPPRNDMRVHATSSTFLPYLLWVTLGLIASALLVVLFWRLKKGASPQLPAFSFLYAALLGVGLIFLIARAMHFGFFGRHAVPLVGVFCCAIAFALSSKTVPENLRNTVAVTLCVVWALSSGRLLFLYPYGKDDVHGAIRAAVNTHLPILWNSGEIEAAYYNAIATRPSDGAWIPASFPSDHWQRDTRFYLLENGDDVMQRELHGIEKGTYIMVSGKPDLFDPTGFWSGERAHWQPVLTQHLNGFDLWKVTVP